MMTNFGSIQGQPLLDFSKGHTFNRVIPARYRRLPDAAEFAISRGLWISPREAFRRWKIARKAWQTRKYRRQLSLFQRKGQP